MHEHQPRESGLFLIHALREVWQNQGLQISYLYGTKEHSEADLLIPHINLTRTPPEYIEYIRSYPKVVNRDIVDISKRRISTNLLTENEIREGPVIVKTDNNYGGRPEYRLARRRHPFLARIWRRAVPIAEYAFGQRLAWRSMLRKYPVYKNLIEVPSGVFKNPALIVERFLPEKEESHYFMRHYLCLGDHTRSVRVVGSTPFLKRSECVLVDEGLPVPDQVLSLRNQLSLDYGKIDYVIHDSQVVILDVNRTPGAPHSPEATACAVNDLADGIWSLLQRPNSKAGSMTEKKLNGSGPMIMEGVKKWHQCFLTA
jgi:hypothetical protein